MTEQHTSGVTFNPWRHIPFAFLSWAIGCSGLGFVAAAISGQHGSIVLFMLGAAIGVTGACVHSVLLLVVSFRRQSRLSQTMLLWVAIASILWMLIVTLEGNASKSLSDMSLFFLQYVATPTLVAATLFNFVVNRAMMSDASENMGADQ
ncbi:MAG: hypothetical protein HY255_09350 [Betaproteobacteria bacterium]|nr:hypothetical protein [Betaproteobacteria bacterium]